MRKTLKRLMVGSLFLFGTTACADLEVTNLNDADAGRSLSTAGDVLSLIGGSYYNWFYGNYRYESAGMAISNAAFQHNAPWANAGMEKYGRLPRVAFVNSIADGDYNYMTRSWFYNYRAIAAVADGLRALEDPDIQAELSADDINMAQAFGRFVLGMAHAGVATLFSEGFVVDETTDVLAPQDPLPYDQLMDVAMGYFDDAISAANGKSWVLPVDWMRAELTGTELAKVAHSMKARYRAAGARNWTERQNLDWTAIMADAAAGVDADFYAHYDDDNAWNLDALGYGTYFGWSQMAYFIYGMADQSGDFQAWNALGLSEKNHTIGGDPVLIVTPDLRFAQGESVDAQRANPGMYFRINAAGSETGSTWARPDRGTWRWSWYKHARGEEYWDDLVYDQPEIRVEEMDLLRAEGLYHGGQLGAAADIINETRTRAGLSATDASGANASCVPKLPNGSCGDLFEMLKWEKRMENTFKGPYGALWFFDGRGWGDLWQGTFLHLPIPCGEAQVLQLLPCQSFGGPGGEDAAPMSVYGWNGEN